MYIFYIDDSGDDGLKSKGSPTDAYVLSAVVVEDGAWLSTLEEIKGFRRFLKNEFGIRFRDELKAGYLIHGTGPFVDISKKSRMKIYKMALRLQDKIGTIKTWAIVADKKKITDPSAQIHGETWKRMIERIERFTYYGKDTCIIFPDEGRSFDIKAKFRQMRRISYVPSAFEDDSFLRLFGNLGRNSIS